MDRDDLVFKAKLAEQAERCGGGRVGAFGGGFRNFLCVCATTMPMMIFIESTNFCRMGKTILRVAIRGDWKTRETNAGRRRDESRARRRSPHAGGVVLAVGVPRTRRLGGFSASVVSFFSLFFPLKRPPDKKNEREEKPWCVAFFLRRLTRPIQFLSFRALATTKTNAGTMK
tara:strand:- start:715 stop:1230 length:516 start_codon:yes stop_codon:yes gene_type:complete